MLLRREKKVSNYAIYYKLSFFIFKVFLLTKQNRINLFLSCFISKCQTENLDEIRDGMLDLLAKRRRENYMLRTLVVQLLGILIVRVYLRIEYTIKHFIRVLKTRRNFSNGKAEACTYIWRDTSGMSLSYKIMNKRSGEKEKRKNAERNVR